jgi:ADP-ribosylglycohydrolase
MIDNANLLNSLIDDGTIRLNKGAILTTTPMPLSGDAVYDKITGMLLGAAIGDSLGISSEGLSPKDRNNKFGEIRNYPAWEWSNYLPIGVPSDDTQLTFWTLKQLTIDSGLIPDNLAKRFCKHHIIGIGTSTTRFVHNYQDKKMPWYRCGIDSLGNGALMRISPIIIPYLKSPHKSMYADAALDSLITHNSYANNASCVAFVHILWQLLSMQIPPAEKWWLDTYCNVTRDLEGNSPSRSKQSKNSDRRPLWQYVEQQVNDAYKHNISVKEACNQWGSGANIFETVPSVLYTLMRHSYNFEDAVIRAVNDTVDNDTVAAIVGAMVGALHGLKGIPYRWIQGLTGRTRAGIDDSGEVFKLILSAKRTFWLE